MYAYVTHFLKLVILQTLKEKLKQDISFIFKNYKKNKNNENKRQVGCRWSRITKVEAHFLLKEKNIFVEYAGIYWFSEDSRFDVFKIGGFECVC